MVKVTDKQYYLDGYAQQVADSICDRVQKRKQDIVCIFDGREGSGKTNASVAIAYYVGHKTGRKFTHENMFFDLDKLIEFAGKTEKQIILWDEAALGGLSSDWSNAAQRKLKAMLMVCRKKRHVFLFNVPRFYRLNADIIERALCLFHIYENDKEQPGNFMFIGNESLVALYQSWKSRRFANYWKFKKLHGFFTFVLPDLVDEEAYEAMKDQAILDLAVGKEEETNVTGAKFKLGELREKIYNKLKIEGKLEKEIAAFFDVFPQTLRGWRKEWS